MKDDIRLVIGFHRHLKFTKLKKILGAQGPLSLIILWTYAAKNRPTGLLHGMDDKDIASASEWKGNAGRFVSACISIGFLDVTGDGTKQIHDWPEHQPWVVKAEARSIQAKHAAGARWEKKAETLQIQEEVDADRIADRNADSNAPTPTPIPTPAPDPTPKEKKDLPASATETADASVSSGHNSKGASKEQSPEERKHAAEKFLRLVPGAGEKA